MDQGDMWLVEMCVSSVSVSTHAAAASSWVPGLLSKQQKGGEEDAISFLISKKVASSSPLFCFQ
jgi:hypothetical protein